MSKVEMFLENQLKYSEATINGDEELAEIYAEKNEKKTDRTYAKASQNGLSFLMS